MVVMGFKGPFTVIQNSGANQYHIDMTEIIRGRKEKARNGEL